MLIGSANTMLRMATKIFIAQNLSDGIQMRLKVEQQDDGDRNPMEM